MAWRDAKASYKKLVLFMASMVLGIAAVVSIQSFSENLKDNIALQSKSLMGADFIIDSDKPINKRVQQIIDSLGGAQGSEISFASMAAFPKVNGTKLLQVRGIDGEFPFYGELETKPKIASTNFQKNRSALVDATVMLQMGLKSGDSIKIGSTTFPIEGSLKSVPGSTALFSSIAPPVIISQKMIEQTGLIQTGSRIDYKYYFVADARQDMDKLDEKLDPILDTEDADLDTHKSTSERLGRRYENFGRFLNLVAFIALILGCIGIASAINIYIKEKLPSIAILKCLGASRKQSFLIFFIQIAGMGLLGGLIGSIAGVFLQQIFPLLLQGLLPVEVEITLAPKILAIGILLGLLMAILFSLYPLISTFYVSPLRALRIQLDQSLRSKKVAIIIFLLIFIFVFLFSYWLLEEWNYAFFFVLGIAITFSILAGIGSLFMKLIRKFFPASWSFVSRQSLLNLYRPQNQTLVLVITIGMGTFLISTLYLTKDLLLAQASVEEQANSPNLILLDIQAAQKDSVANVIKAQNIPVLENIPIVTMKVESIGGISADEIRQDTTSSVNSWILNHEFRTTYRDSLIASEVLEQGKWIGDVSNQKMIPISVSNNFAEDAKVSVGDTISWNVQGVLMNTSVASIRTVDWSRMQLNFSVVFPKGVLEDAPQFRVLTTKVSDDKTSAKLQQELVKRFPNVSIIDIRQILGVIEGLLEKISWLINFMAFFSILTGIIVLIGAVRTSKFQRVRESVLLRTLGARSSQILKIFAMEYFYLGFLGSLSGIVLSLFSSFLLARLVFETAFSPNLLPIFLVLLMVTFLILIIGVTNSLSVIKSPPLKVLRKKLG
ncbi:hypothetical protein DHD80_13755 [Gramella sp. AN32]|nr:hypothetical protein [Gramella sp. AN32]